LKSLDLAENNIGDEGAKALAESNTLAGLELLEIFGSGLTDEGKKQLKESTAFPKLQTLVVE
jgi:hypothetical protein